MTTWRIEDSPNGLRLGAVTRRALGSEQLTWAELLLLRLDAVEVLALYFPSRLDRPEDETARNTLLTFARNSGSPTSVNVWDTTDPAFSQALAFFDLKTPPALVLARGLITHGRRRQLSKEDLYAISVTGTHTLADPTQLGEVLNSAHEVLARGDPSEISGYLRLRAADSLLASLRKLGGGAVEQLIRLKPKFQLPGGISLELGAS